MNELFFYPGACSAAVHIALLEVGLPYTLRRIEVMKGEHLQTEYKNIHPLSRIPALRLEDGTVLTEVGAILWHIDGQRRSDGGPPTLPTQGLAHIRALEWSSLLASGVHIPFAMRINPARFTDEESIFEVLKRDGRLRGFDMLRYVDQKLDPAGTVLPSGPSLLDGYALVFFLWGMRAELNVQELSRYLALAKNQVKRKAVRQMLEEEDLGYVPELVLSL